MLRSVAFALACVVSISLSSAKAETNEEAFGRNCLVLVFFDAVGDGNGDLAWLSASAFYADLQATWELTLLAQGITSPGATLVYEGVEYSIRNVLSLAASLFKSAIAAEAEVLAPEQEQPPTPPTPSEPSAPTIDYHLDWGSPFNPTYYFRDPFTGLYLYESIPSLWINKPEQIYQLLLDGFVYVHWVDSYVRFEE